MEIKIANKTIGENNPVYFIADIAANHDGNLERAKKLITLAKDAGADAVKFQHHDVKHYVSKKGFENLGSQLSHQSKWEKSVFRVYKEAEVPLEWTTELKKHCEEIDIAFFSTPYDLFMVDHLEPHVPAFKIGSGDINFIDMLEKVAGKGKPLLIATGASTTKEVKRAVETISTINKNFILMQCNTNYTGSSENFKYINLNVIKTYKKMFPKLILGLSDHTPGHTTVLGAVALGVKAIEKHFTDDNDRAGPDHPFSMNPKTWKEMVDHTRELEKAMGDGIKKVEKNENQTIILQRRCIRANKDLSKGTIISEQDIEFQRPAPKESLGPEKKDQVLGGIVLTDILKEDILNFENIKRK